MQCIEAWTDDWFQRKESGKWEMSPEYGLGRKGVLCLQDHGYPASFRNIKIKELSKKIPAKTEFLFNGKDLNGWKVYGTELWYVDKEGCLVCESGKDKQYGYLTTRDYYNDFDLNLEFKQLASSSHRSRFTAGNAKWLRRATIPVAFMNLTGAVGWYKFQMKKKIS